MSMKKYLGLSLMMAALAASIDDPFFASCREDVTMPYPKKASLPAWKVGENIIHARNEKDAIKYAKKRGLYNGETPIKIEQE